ncbi:HD-domain/PDEase-like protein [Microthyrium microscopicum]|uniref:Phosphodiesterase n=1 Tax=Microthyrium microscopicum TaxID=703497 RepID=A0A6A6U2T7_9PEZI|nr:HD-domain/PDEase-like protein [Microthyrium microscopicum]
MEHGACNIIYVDRRGRDHTARRNSTGSSLEGSEPVNGDHAPDYFKPDGGKQAAEIHETLDSLLSTFPTVHMCSSGSTCLAKLAEIEEASRDSVPTVVLIDVPYDEEAKTKRYSRETRSPSPTFSRGLIRTMTVDSTAEPTDIYGLRLLGHIASEIQFKKFSKLVIPIAVVSGFERDWAPANVPSPSVHGSQVMLDSVRLTRFIDAGAVDVLVSPLSKPNAHGLAVHAYRTYKDVSKADHAFLASKRNRKLSWVGVDDEKPYAYLREAMVSGLMSGICSPEKDADIIPQGDISSIDLSDAQKETVAKAVGSWSFSAHSLVDDELLYASLIMMEHTLSMPELEKWRIPTSQLIPFLEACQGAYNEFVHYHNFRHAVDVMQACFFFLLQLQVLPEFAHTTVPTKTSPIASLLQPFDALTLLVSAIGHDVGHPGVNNLFLVSLNAPLAQLYNDRSVLESFHCAAYSQILRRHWPSAFKDTTLRRLMINNILATDMGLHFKYMADLGNLQEKLVHDAMLLDTWNAKEKEEYRDLLCGLLIKCADISNVARVFPCAHQWANILTEEFANQGSMEAELGIPTCLFGGPPVVGDLIKLGESQQGFMNIFARPLFESVTDVLPPMHFSVDELEKNKITWQKKISDQQPCTCADSKNCQCARRKDSHNVSPTRKVPLDKDLMGSPLSTTKENKSNSEPSILQGQLAAAQTSITTTALPLSTQPGVDPVLMSQPLSKSLPTLDRGRAPQLNGVGDSNGNTSSNGNGSIGHKQAASTPIIPRESSPSTPGQRAVSAHHPRRKPSPTDDTPLPNGTSSSFAASETDVRYISNGSASKSVHMLRSGAAADESEAKDKSGKNRRLSTSFRRFLKRRWQPKGSVSELQDGETSKEGSP